MWPCPIRYRYYQLEMENDEGNDHEYLIKNVLYFPQSPINILSITDFAKQLDDEEGTGIDTKQLISWFYWDRNKYSFTICHPESNLPEMPINEDYGISQMYSALISKVINTVTTLSTAAVIQSCRTTGVPMNARIAVLWLS